MLQKKVCMVGAFATGKTSLVARFVKGIYSDKYQTTVGVKIDKKRVETSDGTRRATLEVALNLRAKVIEHIGDIPCVTMINKCDLQAEWEITEDDVIALKAQKHTLIRSSAKTGFGVEQCFAQLAQRIADGG